MRQYRHEATDETVEALRLLRGPWTGIRVESGHVTIRLADAREVLLDVEGVDPEPGFEAFRISAAINSDESPPAWQHARERPPFREVPDFAAGRNDVVLFTGATWIEGYDAQQRDDESEPPSTDGPQSAARPLLGRHPIIQFSGHPGQVSESAAAVCHTTDAVLIATTVGTGVLIRTGLQPLTLDVTSDPAALDQFLRERGYRSLGSAT